MEALTYEKSPFLVIWETTRACPLSCIHCRASAQKQVLPGELTTSESLTLVNDIAKMGAKVLVFSGGDPTLRSDLIEVIQYASSLGLKTATIPAASASLTRHTLERLKKAGLTQIAFSLDFPRKELHDSFRGEAGTFDKTLQALNWCQELRLPAQINTVLSAQSLPYLQEMIGFLDTVPIVFWEVFFLVPIGRGRELTHLTAIQMEQAFVQLYEIQKRKSYVLKITEGQHYRRFVAQQEGIGNKLSPLLHRSEGPGITLGHAPRAVNSGKGFMFVAYNGTVSPSGFLPIDCGNVKDQNIAEIYRHHFLFVNLRDETKLLGKCGRCEYKAICGGSRSRAYALTGDAFASEPWCAYHPRSALRN